MKKHFQSPNARIIQIAPTDMVHTSYGFSGGFTMGGWNDFNVDAWDGTLPSGGGIGLGGWTDNGGSAWE